MAPAAAVAGSGGGSTSLLLPVLGSRPARLVGLLHLRDPRRPRGHVLPRPLPHLSLRPRRARDRGLPHRTRRHGPRPRPPPRLRLALRPAGSRAALEARPPRRRRRPPGPHRLHPGAREPLLLRPPRRRRRIPPGRRRSATAPCNRAAGKPSFGLSRGAFPRVQARLAGEGFQGEDKTLALELMPLRYDASRGALVLSRRLTVRVDFAGAEPSEIGRGRLGRRLPGSRPDSSAYAFLATSQKGLHSVAFEALFPGRSRPLDLASLRLTGLRTPRRPSRTPLLGVTARLTPLLGVTFPSSSCPRAPPSGPAAGSSSTWTRPLPPRPSRRRGSTLSSGARGEYGWRSETPPWTDRTAFPRAASPPSRPTASTLPTSSTSRTSGSGSPSAPA